MEQRETYPIEIAGLHRDLQLFDMAPGVRIAILNILGDIELVDASAAKLAEMLAGTDYDVILTAETKSVPIAHMLAKVANKPYVVLRKDLKPYMGDALVAHTESITTGRPQTLILDEKDIEQIRNKRVVLVDDVISTGSTLRGMRQIVDMAGGHVVREAAILTEGDPEQWKDIVTLGHLPVFTR